MRLASVVVAAIFGIGCGSGGGGSQDTSSPPADAADVAPLDVPAYPETGEDAGADLAADVPVEDTTTQTDVGDTAFQDPGVDTAPPPSCLAGAGGTSTLPGVRIEFSDTAECAFTQSKAAAGVKIGYQVIVEHDVTDVKTMPQDAGHCDQPAWTDGLILFEDLGGQGQRYCKCDSGLCAPPAPKPVTLKKGVYPFEFVWHGRNWAGPSDTGNPEGSPFPPGHYVLQVGAIGEAKILGMPTFQEFEVAGTFPVEVLPDPKPEIPELIPDEPKKDYFIPAPEADEE
ncbi:MAG: hypothetical protein FJ087_06875, partial [Deltaproteobacteria bacterium]|nr:hypothetical protein [Deltaproteobacteria bacterium]